MKKYNILITAGGTSEKIDDVRHITNSGTGRLGALVAEAYAANCRECRLTYICSANAVRPGSSRIRARVADDVLALREEVEKACAETAFDIVVHSMAVGDYRVRAVTDARLMVDGVTEQLLGAAQGGFSQEEAIQNGILNPAGIRAAKISSDKENLIVVLERAPKIISLLRGLAPRAVIVGFKLLAETTEEELVRAGHGLLTKNDCDYVLANDMRTVRSDRHEGLLVARDGTFGRAAGKADIAALIVRRTLDLAQERGK
jgi:phosphopantothenate-cysteine ligase